jgi:hypothetical protein
MGKSVFRVLVFAALVGFASFAEGAFVRRQCGITGTVDERVADCDLRGSDGLRETWSLVTFQRSFFLNVWIVRQESTGALWMGSFEASQLAARSTCSPGSTHPHTGGIQAAWTIASETDYSDLWMSGGNEFVVDANVAEPYWTDKDGVAIDVETWTTLVDDPRNVRPVICLAR